MVLELGCGTLIDVSKISLIKPISNGQTVDYRFDIIVDSNPFTICNYNEDIINEIRNRLVNLWKQCKEDTCA